METLREILMNSSAADLEVLAEYQKELTKYQTVSSQELKISFLINEIRHNGGNTFANLIRGNGVEYDEIVRDVAKHLKVNFNSQKPPDTDFLELEIIKKMITDEFSKMDPAQQKEVLASLGAENMDLLKVSPVVLAGLLAANLSGFAIFRLSAIAANAIARFILGRGLTFGANTLLTRSLAVATGPVGWVLGTAWMAVDLAGPAYRITVPSVIHIALLRQKYRTTRQPQCSNCGAPVLQGTKFCAECGTKI